MGMRHLIGYLALLDTAELTEVRAARGASPLATPLSALKPLCLRPPPRPSPQSQIAASIKMKPGHAGKFVKFFPDAAQATLR